MYPFNFQGTTKNSSLIVTTMNLIGNLNLPSDGESIKYKS